MTFVAPQQEALFASPTAPPLATRFASPSDSPATVAFPPTDEQRIAVDAYLAGQHLVICAGAGTGKTSTLRLIAQAKPNRRGIYVSYNAAIAASARGKFPSSVDCRTAHSLAYQAIGHRFAHRLPARGRQSGARRLPARDVANMLDVSGARIGGRWLPPVALVRLAEETVSQFCRSADTEILAGHVPVPAGFDAPSGIVVTVLPIAMRMWRDITDPDGQLWFTHDHYLKMWQLSEPRLPADFVLFDEAQDADPVIAAIVANQAHMQRIYVGDQSQAINRWRGAVDAMNGFQGTRVPLTQSFRFGEAIADEANAWLAMLGADLRIRGYDKISSTVDTVHTPTAILCRTNGGTIAAVLDHLAAGHRVHLEGDGREMKTFAWAARDLMSGRPSSLPELAAFRSWKELVEYATEEHSGLDLQSKVKLIQRYGPGTIITAIEQLSPKAACDITISTAHKAKGLEWRDVRIGDDFQEPADGQAVEVDELMLAYVAVTRAQHRLDVGSLAWRHGGTISDGLWQWRADRYDRTAAEILESL